MKAEERDIINLKIKLLYIELAKINEEYSSMHQIDMQGGEGSRNRERAHKAEGQIHALKWVLDKV